MKTSQCKYGIAGNVSKPAIPYAGIFETSIYLGLITTIFPAEVEIHVPEPFMPVAKTRRPVPEAS